MRKVTSDFQSICLKKKYPTDFVFRYRLLAITAHDGDSEFDTQTEGTNGMRACTSSSSTIAIAEPSKSFSSTPATADVRLSVTIKTGDSDDAKGVVTFRSGSDRFIRCDICRQFPLIVKRYGPKKPPAMTTETGTRYRQTIRDEHVRSQYHIECVKADKIKSLRVDDQAPPMDVAVSKANAKMTDFVGKLMIQVYNDGKRLNLSAFSWPSRFVSSEASSAFSSNSECQAKGIIAGDLNLQYVNPPGHLQLMSTIVSSHREELLKKIEQCHAISLRVDGSIDLSQLDKIYVMGKLINSDGSPELVFLGVGEQKERGAKGLMAAVDDALRTVVGDPDTIYRKMSSICTDGANINVGEKNSLWTLLTKRCNAAGSKIPLLKLWCAAHRSELAWKKASKSNGEVSKALSVMSSIASYFHTSSIRSSGLKKIASEHGLKLISLPKLFEIRWTQFTFQLLRGIVVSWKALTMYFGENILDSACAGYRKYLTNYDNLQLIAFLADLLFSYMRFQKNMQGNKLTVISMKKYVTGMISSLSEGAILPGGFEAKLKESLKKDKNGSMFVKDVEVRLLSAAQRAISVKPFVQVRASILVSLKEFLEARFESDEALL